MRAPSLLAQCLPGFTPPERGSQTISTISERGSSIPLPAVEVLPSKGIHPFKYGGENADLQGIGMSKHEIRDGQLSFRGKRVLELGCNYGLPGIFACLKGASTVHFQGLCAEVIRCTTIPNVLIALKEVRDWQSRQLESPLTPSRQALSPSVHFYAGDWDELHGVLSMVRNDYLEVNTGLNFCFSEKELGARISPRGIRGSYQVAGHGRAALLPSFAQEAICSVKEVFEASIE